MKVVATHSDVDVPVEHGRNTIHLDAGIEYVMHDVEVESGLRADVFASVRDITGQPDCFDSAQPMTGKLIAPFIGGLGDAISMLPLLAATRKAPQLQPIPLAHGRSQKQPLLKPMTLR